MKQLQIIEPLGDNVVLKGTIENSLITVDDKEQRKIEKVEVFRNGPDVTKVKEGAEVFVSPIVFSEVARIVDPFRPRESFDTKSEFYMVVKENEIIGIYK